MNEIVEIRNFYEIIFCQKKKNQRRIEKFQLVGGKNKKKQNQKCIIYQQNIEIYVFLKNLLNCVLQCFFLWLFLPFKSISI